MAGRKVTNNFEYQGGARDGEKVPYRVSDLVITPDSPMATGKIPQTNSGVGIKREQTQLGFFWLGEDRDGRE